MKYGKELVADLQAEIATLKASVADRIERINNGETDWDDCFISERCESRGIALAEDKIRLIENGGCEWFIEYATLDGKLVNARWCDTRYGMTLRAEMPNGEVVWTSSYTDKGLAKKGLKRVKCLRPAWFRFASSGRGMMGVYTGSYVTFPSSWNYATGERAGDDPIEMKDV